ncbi:hypothetical protein K0I73_18060 [Shewanella mesophila]|uniref:hypothetical protein n=1 Tax=Shewanella mesophila TaxID=2864208 RepID=UPI001C65F55C|nr:hypothetical protein [Shewanella mesophila]QYJ86033.1 hypothetical protein K0I73_18060 [Shewanella mesophila]
MRYLILFVLSLTFSTSSYALTVNISVKGQNVRYENSRDWGRGYYVATTSEIFSSLEPTKKWIPAMQRVNKNVTLIGPSSEQATVQVLVQGLEYDWGSLSNSTAVNDKLGLESGYCSNSTTSSMTTILNNSMSSCISSAAIITKSGAENIPFYFVRPIFEIKELLTALKGKPEGVYVGNLTVPVRYYFYNSMSILTYRNLSFNLTFQVNYIPEMFTSLVVTPENGGVMPPQYGSGTVKGETRFNIETVGYFNTGIKMKFDTSKDYSLTHASQTDKKIPYYVHCDTCDDKVIVDEKGKMTTSVLNSAGVVLAPVGSDKTRINYNLTVGYSDKTVNEVVTGGYSGSFVVVFGLDF